MKLLQLVKSELKPHKTKLLGLTLLAGLSNIMLVEVVHSAAENVANNNIQQRYFVIYILCCFLFLMSKKYTLDMACEVMENIVYRIRYRITDKIRQTELATLEDVGIPSIYTRLTQDSLDISNMSAAIIWNTQTAFMVCFMLIYLLFISPAAFGLVFLGVLLAVYNFLEDNERSVQYWKSQSIKEKEFFEKFNHILGGFKEIRVNRKKNNSVFATYTKVLGEKSRLRISVMKMFNNKFVYAQACIYVTLCILVFVLPFYHEEQADSIIKTIAVIFFILGPLEAILNASVNFFIADNAAYNILELEKELNKKLKQNKQTSSKANMDYELEKLSFKNQIELHNLSYQYNNNAFSVGPINLSIQKGELIFITGGNGSGKSTFLKMFIGLYMPKKGTIYIDRNIEKGEMGTHIDVTSYDQYRELFTLIFTDFHLFDKLYGLEGIDEDIVNKLLIELDLPPEKTVFRKGGFSNISLSSGQKKRLALATSILEDKDIYIYDEVAADLDPWFRDVYYYKILSKLKARNKTVFVVSHDKEYWHIADRILFMEKGQLSELTEKEIDEHYIQAEEAAAAMMEVKLGNFAKKR